VAIGHAAPVLESENSIVAPVPEPEKEKLNCAIKYLKGVNQLDANFPEYPATGNAIDVCENYLKDSRTAIYDSLVSLLRKNVKTRPYKHCTMEKLRADESSDLVLKQMVYESATDLNIENREAKADKLYQALLEKTKGIIKNCIFEKEFGNDFDNLIKNKTSSSEKEDFLSDYCLRKHVSDNNLIDSSYNLVLNPKNIDITTVNCAPIVQKAISDAEEEFMKFLREGNALSQTKIDCVVEYFYSKKYFERDQSVLILGEAHLNDEQIAAERASFIKYMLDLNQAIQTCDKNVSL